MPNYSNSRLGHKVNVKHTIGKGKETIFMEKIGREQFISFSVGEAKEVVIALAEIIDAVENHSDPVIGDSVTIIDGQFKGMTGRVYDVDSEATEMELAIKIDKTKYNDSFYAYVDMGDVE